jgi:hypothetical protein
MGRCCIGSAVLKKVRSLEREATPSFEGIAKCAVMATVSDVTIRYDVRARL